MFHVKHFPVHIGMTSCIILNMMGWLFAFMLTGGFLISIINGNGGALLSYMLEGAEQAVSLSLSFAGSYILWMGIMNIANRAGLIEKIAKISERPLKLLMPRIGAAAAPVTLNLSANFFGLGNAATPFGLEAMKKLKEISSEGSTATDEMCMFLALNSSAIELMPTMVISIRIACGAAEPYSIVLPAFISSITSAAAAITVCKIFEHFGRKRRHC